MGLFSKKPTHAEPAGAPGDHETAFLGTNLTIKGKISGSGNLIMMGKLEGEFELGGELVIAPPAVVTGEVKAVRMTVSGTVSGKLTARDKIHLEKSADVSGRLTTPCLTVADGALFNGDIEMKKPAAGPVKAPAAGK
jgi:cytoskeletal protein CcmA (bactofilin family)